MRNECPRCGKLPSKTLVFEFMDRSSYICDDCSIGWDEQGTVRENDIDDVLSPEQVVLRELGI